MTLRLTPWLRGFVTTTCLLIPLGCGTSEKSHTVQGKVSVVGGDVTSYEGHVIEFAHSTDTNLRASGIIGRNGRFQLETLRDGKVQHTVNAGQYNARFVVVDEGDGQRKKPTIPDRYLRFETSGWQITVPSPGEVELTITLK